MVCHRTLSPDRDPSPVTADRASDLSLESCRPLSGSDVAGPKMVRGICWRRGRLVVEAILKSGPGACAVGGLLCCEQEDWIHRSLQHRRVAARTAPTSVTGRVEESRG